jgi:hypothetical protein
MKVIVFQMFLEVGSEESQKTKLACYNFHKQIKASISIIRQNGNCKRQSPPEVPIRSTSKKMKKKDAIVFDVVTPFKMCA